MNPITLIARKEGGELAKIAPNVAIKLPLTPDGMRACGVLSKEGVMINATLCFSAAQAILAAKAGVTFVSPFVGRMDDVGEHGMGLIKEIVDMYRNYEWKTQVLVASIRHVRHMIEAVRIGAHVATLPFKVLGTDVPAPAHHPRPGAVSGRLEEERVINVS